MKILLKCIKRNRIKKFFKNINLVRFMSLLIKRRYLYKKLDVKNLDRILSHIKSFPLISICIPAYKYSFFEDALKSALNQTYSNTEIIVCDDSTDKYIENIVKKYKNNKIFYIRNQINIGARNNYKKCFNLSSGEYIKFLNDDDLLHEDCIKTMVEYFESYGDTVSLVTSNRNIINRNGNVIENLNHNGLFFTKDIYIKGRNLGDYILENISNIIGEPTTVLFRKKDANKIPHGIFNLKDGNNYRYLGNTDVVMWLNLLTLGDAIYIVKPLSFFRYHDEQLSKNMEVKIRCTVDWVRIIKNAKEIGYLRKNRTFESALLKTYHMLNKLNADNLDGNKKSEIIKSINEIKILLNIENKP